MPLITAETPGVAPSVEHGRPIHEREVVVVEFRQASEVGEEASPLDPEIVGQRRGDDRRLLDVEAVHGAARNSRAK